jgi:AraC-like DNA-binding protein/quercetin dioxygenase-like cupin family protein
MKVLPFKIPKPENATLIVQVDKGAVFYAKLHQHQEIQISLIKKGEGTYIIGDAVGEFNPGDIFVIGENLPHVFNNDETEEEVHMISLFFMKSSYGEHFFTLPEFKDLDLIFGNSALGFKLEPPTDDISQMMERLAHTSKLSRFITFMEILRLMGQGKMLTLSSALHTKIYGEEEGKRMSDIFGFTLDHFDKNISLHEVAEIANMTPNAFCRYFKQRTNKTYINFLLDIRIGNACKLLTKKTDLSIAEIAYKSGFNNLTNFNRKFKSIKGLTPSEFRKRI